MPATSSPTLAAENGSSRAGEGVFDTIPIEADYTVGDMKMWLKFHKGKDSAEYDLMGPKGVWKMGAGSEVYPSPPLASPLLTPARLPAPQEG